jgi:hypothetical protein
MRRFLTLVILVFSCGLSHAQINFKAAYRLVVTDPTTFNIIIKEHNQTIEEDPIFKYSKEFPDLKIMNGFDLGFRYKVPGVSFELGWGNRRRQLRADGKRLNGSSYENKITTTINTVSAGIFPTFGPVSFGGTIDYNYLKIKTEFEQPGLGASLKDNTWSSKLSISYNFKSSGAIGVTIRPYIDIFWSEYDITEFSEDINPTSPAPESPLKETFKSWGISFIIYNGPQ